VAGGSSRDLFSESSTQCLLPRACNPPQVHFGKTKQGEKTATARLIFQPTLWERLRGHKDIVMKKPLDARYLFERDLTDEQRKMMKDDEKTRRDNEKAAKMFGF